MAPFEIYVKLTVEATFGFILTGNFQPTSILRICPRSPISGMEQETKPVSSKCVIIQHQDLLLNYKYQRRIMIPVLANVTLATKGFAARGGKH